MTITAEELRKVYGEAESAHYAKMLDEGIDVPMSEVHDAALLAVARYVAEKQRAMEPTKEMIDAGGDEEIGYETESHYTICIGPLSAQVYRAMQSVAPLVVD